MRTGSSLDIKGGYGKIGIGGKDFNNEALANIPVYISGVYCKDGRRWGVDGGLPDITLVFWKSDNRTGRQPPFFDEPESDVFGGSVYMHFELTVDGHQWRVDFNAPTKGRIQE